MHTDTIEGDASSSTKAKSTTKVLDSVSTSVHTPVSASLSAPPSNAAISTINKNMGFITNQTRESSVNDSDFFDQFLNISLPSNDNNNELFQVLETSSITIPQFCTSNIPNKTSSLPNLNSPLESKIESPQLHHISSNKSDSEFFLNHSKIEINFNKNASSSKSNYNNKTEKNMTQEIKDEDPVAADLSSSPTIPMDSPSMHSPQPVINEIKRVTTPPIPKQKVETKQSFNKPPTFAVTKSTSLKLSENSIATYSEKAHILKLLRKGLETYTSILSNMTTDTIEPRADYLSNYLKSLDLHIKPRVINDLFAEIKNNKLGTNVLKIIDDPSFITQFQNLLIESHRRRKHYNKRRQSKLNTPSNSTTGLALSSSSHQFPPIQRKPSVNTISKISASIDVIKIGSLVDYYHCHDDSNFKSIVNLKNIPRCIENKSFLSMLKSSDPNLQSCIDGIPPNHAITYTKTPIILNSQININLDTDQMVSYSNVLIDLTTILNNSVRVNFNLQLKSITKIYSGSNLIQKRCDPINGYFLNNSDNSNIVKLILPFQAKFWASLLNDFHNGSITFKKFDTLKISHTIYNNDDFIKFKISNGPIHSFIWDFNTQLSQPISFNIDLGVTNSESTNNTYQIPNKKDSTSKLHNTVPVSQNKTFQTNTINNSFTEYIPLNPSNTFSKPNSLINPKLNMTNSMISLPHQQQFFNGNNHSATLPQHVSFTIDDYTNNSQNSVSSIISNPPISSSLQTSTPNSFKSNSRGHKRTRSRSMNEIDLLSINLSNYISQSNSLINFEEPTLNFYPTTNNSGNSAGTGVQQQNIINTSNSQLINTSNTMSELSKLTFLDNSVSLAGTQFNDSFLNNKNENFK